MQLEILSALVCSVVTVNAVSLTSAISGRGRSEPGRVKSTNNVRCLPPVNLDKFKHQVDDTLCAHHMILITSTDTSQNTWTDETNTFYNPLTHETNTSQNTWTDETNTSRNTWPDVTNTSRTHGLMKRTLPRTHGLMKRTLPEHMA
ncbi:uncharacterized protein LOC124292388 [Haliotis rubra]|uniref:uncharacterized protein LOC124292388 n=1 Tax=Haliotis rubra TaxID=36100 RepID=UPI001EE5097B|nr:uncharacterized protein LOC124292388 [Haliotis rubra]